MIPSSSTHFHLLLNNLSHCASRLQSQGLMRWFGRDSYAVCSSGGAAEGGNAALRGSQRILEYLSTGSGFPRRSTGAGGRKRFSTKTYRKPLLFILTGVSENLRKPPGVYGRMQFRNPGTRPFAREESRGCDCSWRCGSSLWLARLRDPAGENWVALLV